MKKEACRAEVHTRERVHSREGR